MLIIINDRLDHVKMIFKRSWYSHIWEDKATSKNFVENGEDEIGDLNGRINRLKIEEKNLEEKMKKSIGEEIT